MRLRIFSERRSDVTNDVGSNATGVDGVAAPSALERRARAEGAAAAAGVIAGVADRGVIVKVCSVPWAG